jgi:segregation and condensation protein B
MEFQFAEIMAAVEAILFVAGDPVNVRELAHSMNLTELEMAATLDEMARGYEETRRGIRLNRNGGEAYLSINPAFAEKVEAYLQPLKRQPLSQAVLETLSVIAYRQPATKAEVEAVRGVKCDYSVQFLVRRGLVEECGRRETLGRPIEYRTTDKFLMHFGIESLTQLPDINELEPAADVSEPISKGPFE